MATPSTSPLSVRIPFVKNKALLAMGDIAGIDVTPPDPSLLQSLADKKPFPRRQIVFLDVNASAAGIADMGFLTNRGKVAFKGKGSAFASLAVIPDPNAAASAIGLDESVPLGMALPRDAAGAPTHYVLLRWGFDTSGSASGKMALGNGAVVTVGANAGAESVCAVLRRFPDGAASGMDELTATAGAWMLPSHVKDETRLEPGTWIVAEVEGAVAASLGIQYGINYNWVREAQMGGLTGDIGLKLQLGASAALGLNLAGKYAVVVSRESDERKIRLRLFKLAKHGFDFALNASVTARADFTHLLPKQADDFLKAILGVHGAQIAADLRAIEKWTGSRDTLSGLLAKAGIDYTNGLVKDLTGIDPAEDFDAARSRVAEFTGKWTALDHKVATLILKFFEQGVELGPVKEAASLVAGLDAGGLARILGGRLSVAGFAATPVARYLDMVATSGVLSLLDPGPALAEAKAIADATLQVLDGSAIEQVVRKLQARIESTLGLEDLLAAVETGLSLGDFKHFDRLLQAKLAAFIDKEPDTLGLEDLEKLRKAIGLFLAKRKKFYDQAVKALNQPYKAELAATYESARTDTALVDVEFDFERDRGGLSTLLQSAIDGRFDKVGVNGRVVDILADTIDGVNLRRAVLTHAMKRHAHQELHLPYFIKISDHMNSADASLSAGTDMGRMFVTAHGRDVISDISDFNSNRNRRDSTLAVASQFPVAAGAIAVHSTDGMTYSYQLRQAAGSMTRDALLRQVRPYADALFMRRFGNVSERGTLESLIDSIRSAAQPGAGRIGNTLVSLDVAVSPALSAAWFQRPANQDDERARRKRLSISIQSAMRRIVPYFYFRDLHNFNRSAACSALVLYASLPGMARDSDCYFDYRDALERDAFFAKPQVDAALEANMQAIADLLASAPESAGMASSFEPDPVNKDRILRDVTSGHGETNLMSLLFTEAEMIGTAVIARNDILRFGADIEKNRDAAIRRLADFSSRITETFNSKVNPLYGGGEVRPLGSLVFVQACMALMEAQPAWQMSLLPSPFASSAPPSETPPDWGGVKAMLDVIVLRSSAAFPPPGYFEGRNPEPAAVLIETPITT